MYSMYVRKFYYYCYFLLQLPLLHCCYHHFSSSIVAIHCQGYICNVCMYVFIYVLLNVCVSQGRAAVEFNSETDSLSDLVYASLLLSDADIRKELVSNIGTVSHSLSMGSFVCMYVCMLCTVCMYTYVCMYVCLYM